MTVNKTRSWLYGIARILGDVQAAQKATRTKSSKPIVKRVGRRLAGKLTARMLSRLFRW